MSSKGSDGKERTKSDAANRRERGQLNGSGDCPTESRARSPRSPWTVRSRVNLTGEYSRLGLVREWYRYPGNARQRHERHRLHAATRRRLGSMVVPDEQLGMRFPVLLRSNRSWDSRPYRSPLNAKGGWARFLNFGTQLQISSLPDRACSTRARSPG